jgi:hypothetical protein
MLVRALAFLLKRMQDVYGFRALGQIKHSEGTAGIAHANLSYSRPNREES